MHGTPHTVADVMTRTVVAVVGDTVFKDIVKAMGRWRVSALPVVDGGHRALGVVSEADLLPKEEFHDGDPDRYARLRRLSDLAKAGARTAEELMTAPAVTLLPVCTKRAASGMSNVAAPVSTEPAFH